MSDPVQELRGRAVRGIRGAMIANLVTLPMSFVMNIVFGRVSPAALGYYGAIQIFVGMFITLCVLGGPQVFTRFVPSLGERDRIPFLLSYTAVCLGIFLTGATAAFLLVPGGAPALLGKFGQPSTWQAYLLPIEVLVWVFCSHYLYGALEGTSASVILKSVTAGYFLFAILCLGPLRGVIDRDPSGALWAASLAVYGIAGVIGLSQVARKSRRVEFEAMRWHLPPGFWSVAVYVHVSALVAFVYFSLAPSIVLLWMDVQALAFLHAATRYPVLIATLPAMMGDVIAPGFARLEATGLQPKALQQAAAAIDASVLASVPVVLGVVFFASDAMALFGPTFVDHRGLARLVALSALSGPVVYIGIGMLAAFGLFRSYLAASSVYVVASVSLALALIPMFGLTGAAAAATLSAFLQHVTVAALLRRRLGFALSRRSVAAWACGAAAYVVADWLDPGRLMASVLFVVFMTAFCFAGAVRVGEVVGLARRFTGRG